MNPVVHRWAPFALLAVGAAYTVGIDTQRAMTLRQPLSATVPAEWSGLRGTDIQLSPEEVRVAGMTTYLARAYRPDPGAEGPQWVQVYVGYYERQTQGRTIHSPKNCLPGSGWEPLASRTVVIETDSGPVTVNRYLLKREDEAAVVLYWYQGRGRVAANEYAVKWDLLRDAALRRRTEEALVRVVVPVSAGEDAAFAIAARLAGMLVPAVGRSLPS